MSDDGLTLHEYYSKDPIHFQQILQLIAEGATIIRYTPFSITYTYQRVSDKEINLGASHE